MAGRVNFVKYIRSYHSNSIFFRNLALILLLVTIPLVLLGLFAFQYNRNILDEEIRKANTRSLLKFQASMDIIQNEIERIAVQMINNQDVMRFLTKELDDYPDYPQIELLQSIVYDMNLAIHNYIHSIAIYSARNSYLLTSAGGGEMWKWTSNSMYSRIIDPDREWAMDYQRVAEQATPMQTNFLTFYKRFPSTGQDIPTGAVAILLDINKVSSFLYGSGSSESEIIFVVDRTGKILFSTELQWVGQLLNEIAGFRYGPAFDPESIETAEYGGKAYVFSYLESSVNDWFYCTFLSKDTFFEKQRILRRIMFIALSFSVMVSIGTAFLISLFVFKPIHEVINMLENPNDIPDYESYDNELKFIAGNIMHNYNEFQQDRQEIENRISMLNAARVRALQAQINPHFLNNTLQLANWIILRETQNEESEAIAVLENLADLVRVNMETKSNLISLAGETEYVSKYMAIQKRRYGNKIQFRESVPEELQSVPVLKMLIQPIVENAIYHGLKKKEDAGIISLEASRSDGHLVIEVEDNGMGMDIGDIERLNEELRTVDSLSDNHIGLTNISLRLRLVFGPKSGIRLAPRKGGGIRVITTIPIR